MQLRSRSIRTAILGFALAAVAAACAGVTATTAPPASSPPVASPVDSASGSPTGSPAAGGSASATPSGSGTSQSPAASPSPVLGCVPGLNLGHLDPALEDKLPCTIGGIGLERFSFKLSEYIGSSSGGDRELYNPWLVQFGLTPEDVSMAVVADLTQHIHFVIHAISIPGVADGQLVSSFADQAKKAGWPVTSVKIASTSLMEIVDPAAVEAGTQSVGYVYAKDHVLFTIITDDPNLLLEAIAKLP
jgi:hypothetical protein